MSRGQQWRGRARAVATRALALGTRVVSAVTPGEQAAEGDGPALRRLLAKSWGFWAVACAAFVGLYQPGIFYFGDSYDHLQQALTLHLDNWHPPILPLAWSALYPFLGVRAPFVAHCLIYFAAFGLISHCFVRRRRRMSVSLVLLAFSPPALLRLMLVAKDASLAVTVLLLSALYLCGRGRAMTLARGIGIAAALYYAVNVRHAVFLALAPVAGLFLLPLLAPSAISRRRMGASVLAGLVVCGVLVLANSWALAALYQPRPARSSHHLYFDMVGTLTRAGAMNEMPGRWLPDPRSAAEVSRIYWRDPCSANPYTGWGEAGKLVQETEMANLVGDWLRVVAGHPLAYLKHRLAFSWQALTHGYGGPDETATPSFQENVFLSLILVGHWESTGVPTAKARAAAEELYDSTLHRPNAVSNLLTRSFRAANFLLLPLLHLLFALATATVQFVRREYDLRFALAATAALGILLHCFSSPELEARYVYWCYLANVIVAWCWISRIEGPEAPAGTGASATSS